MKDSIRLNIGAVMAVSVYIAGLVVLSHAGTCVFIGVTCLYIGDRMAEDIGKERKCLK